MWGWMSRAGVGVLERIRGRFNAPQYQHIFENVMLRLVRVRNPEGNLIFQQDNHPVHSSMGVQRRPEIELIPWPPKSPDLNVVELIWAKLKGGRILTYGKTHLGTHSSNGIRLWKSGIISLRTTTIALPWSTLFTKYASRS